MKVARRPVLFYPRNNLLDIAARYVVSLILPNLAAQRTGVGMPQAPHVTELKPRRMPDLRRPDAVLWYNRINIQASPHVLSTRRGYDRAIGGSAMSMIIPQTPGVYQFTCIPTGKLYIGGSLNIRKRHQQHVNDLKAGRHHSVHLQRAWDCYGVDAFVFSVIELTDAETLRAREQYHLDRLQAYDRQFGFNIAPVVDNRVVSLETGARISAAKRGHPVSVETREKLRAARLRQPDPSLGRKHTPEQVERMRARLRGRKLSEAHRQITLANTARTPEREAARIAGCIKSYVVTAPDGAVYHVTNLSAFCRDHGLGVGLQKVANGKRRQYKGWTCRHDDD